MTPFQKSMLAFLEQGAAHRKFLDSCAEVWDSL